MFSACLLATVLTGARLTYRGGDVSFLPQLEAAGAIYQRDDATSVDPLELMKQRGCNIARVRIWNNPPDGHSGVSEALTLAKRIKRANLHLLLDFHYSDTWADPSHQTKPAAWSALSNEELKTAVRSFTRDTVNQFIRQGTVPEIVQVGNEVRAGILWPEGSSSNFDTFAGLMSAGLAGVKQAGPLKKSITTMVHTDSGGDLAASQWLYDGLLNRGVKFDLIGLSYYPLWHGSLDGLSANLANLATRYSKEIVVVETGYPWTFEAGPFTSNPRVWGSSNGILPGYPATPTGQGAFVSEVCRRVAATPNGLGCGVLYWAPDWVGSKKLASSGDNMATYDFAGKELPALSALGAG